MLAIIQELQPPSPILVIYNSHAAGVFFRVKYNWVQKISSFPFTFLENTLNYAWDKNHFLHSLELFYSSVTVLRVDLLKLRIMAEVWLWQFPFTPM